MMRAIITFHDIGTAPGPLSYPAASLARLITGLRQANLPIVDLPTLLADKDTSAVAFTFDDGMASVASAALPILRDAGVPAHLFLTTAAVGGDNRWPGQPRLPQYSEMLSWAQIEALHAGGVSIDGHTDTHPDLRALGDAAIEDDMAANDALIAARLGRTPSYFAYPYGYHDARVRRVAARRYRASVTTEFDHLRPDSTPDRLPRLDSHYLRHPVVMRNLASPGVGAYLALRGLIRRLRGIS
jgi:peptidoglycan/xylan/chitin deacetylase (PgdA/CDA1 family)